MILGCVHVLPMNLLCCNSGFVYVFIAPCYIIFIFVFIFIVILNMISFWKEKEMLIQISYIKVLFKGKYDLDI